MASCTGGGGGQHGQQEGVLKQGGSQGKLFFMKSQGKGREFHEKLSKSGKNEIVIANILEMLAVHFIYIFCQSIRVTSVTYCYTAESLELGGKAF